MTHPLALRRLLPGLRALLLPPSFPLGLSLGLLGALPSCARPLPLPQTSLDEQPARIVSAFFGLDHAMPGASRWLCREAPGQDGIPVTFSRRVVGPTPPDSFAVRLRSGALRRPACATTAPANERAENHTVLLIGDLGREPEDPPVAVEITGPLALEGGAEAKGLSAPMIALTEGPTLVLALGLRPGSIKSDCPARTRQIVVVIWAGGVTPVGGADQASHLAGYRVRTAAGEVAPTALGDLEDRDNYVHLCLETESPAEGVSFAAGLLADPRGDPNPATSVAVSPGR